MVVNILQFVWALFGWRVTVDEEHIPATRHRLKSVDTYEITVSDFNRIKLEAGSVGTHLQFATALVPLSVSLWITLFTVSLETVARYTILVFAVISLCEGVFHSALAYRERGRFSQMMEDLKSLQAVPFGSEGNELKPTDLASLPAQQAGPIQIPIEAPAVVVSPSDQS